MASNRILILGAGGHARVVASLLVSRGWDVEGVLDHTSDHLGEAVGSSAIVGTIEDLPRWRDNGSSHVALAIGDNSRRAELFHWVRTLEFAVPLVVHPKAIVEPSAELAQGSLICAGAVVAAEASIGANALINTGAIVDHECRIGDHAHIGPGAVVAGRSVIETGVFVGAGATVRDGVVVGSRTLIGAGAAVVSDLAAGVVAYGVPATVRRPTGRRDG
jgi:UDP-perosamine 4-acetyltransferase